MCQAQSRCLALWLNSPLPEKRIGQLPVLLEIAHDLHNQARHSFQQDVPGIGSSIIIHILQIPSHDHQNPSEIIQKVPGTNNRLGTSPIPAE
jgi:hypothetical protein